MSIESAKSMKAHGIWSRRELLQSSGCGLGALALASLLHRDGVQAAEALHPLAARPPHFPATAKRVIFLFMFGGPSQVDLFDPKPALAKWDGQTVPDVGSTPILKSPYTFRKYGDAGIPISEKFVNLGRCADDLCILRSMYAEIPEHRPAIFQMNTGFLQPGKPSMGAWAVYGLGSECDNLPAFVVMLDQLGAPFGGSLNWSSGFMPATYQGTLLRTVGEPIADLFPPKDLSADQQRARLELLAELNAKHMATHPEETALAARMASYELAFRMQMQAPEAVDVSQETAGVQRLYGLDDLVTEPFGRQCLLARRLVERGVRFVQIYSGGGNAMGTTGWDAHEDIKLNHDTRCRQTDLPIAGLLTDLKARGLLDSTLVIWGGEFGRTPTSQGPGRDHNVHGFTMWLAGGGVRGGFIHGGTDEFGRTAVDQPVAIADLHATCLHLMGLDHKKLTFRSLGRDMRLTDVRGNVVRNILA